MFDMFEMPFRLGNVSDFDRSETTTTAGDKVAAVEFNRVHT